MKITKFALLLITLVLLTTRANALMVDVSFTGDNIVQGGGLCEDSACQDGIGWDSFGTLSNPSDWRFADTVNVLLGPGIHYFAWLVQNFGGAGGSDSGNPAGLLAQITGPGIANYSSSSWDVSLDEGTTWSAATQWAQNGAGIWGSVKGGPVGGISNDAYWIWSDENFTSETSEFAWLRTSVTVLSEPGTLIMLGIGFVAIALIVRRKRKVL